MQRTFQLLQKRVVRPTLGSVRYCAKELEISLAKIDRDSATEKQRWQMGVLYTDAVELENHYGEIESVLKKVCRFNKEKRNLPYLGMFSVHPETLDSLTREPHSSH